MTKGNAIRYYRKFSGADAYILGFIYKKMLYMIAVDEIMPRYMAIKRASSKSGGGEKLQFVLNNALKEQLIRKGAMCIGSADMVTEVEGNKGVSFERLVYKLNGQTPRDRDSVGFWKCGDININGTEYQVKFEGAQIVSFRTLHNLQQCGADYKNYQPKVGRKKLKIGVDKTQPLMI